MWGYRYGLAAFHTQFLGVHDVDACDIDWGLDDFTWLDGEGLVVKTADGHDAHGGIGLT